MVDEKITIAELGAYTNNSPNKEGIKKVVKAINDGLNPDLSDYQKKLTAGDNITITEEDVISASKTVYTAGEGIKILSDEISLQDWEYVDPTKYSELFDNNYRIKEDIVLSISDRYSGFTPFFIPKGFTQVSSMTYYFPLGSSPNFVIFSYLNLTSVNTNVTDGATIYDNSLKDNTTYFELSINETAKLKLRKVADNTVNSSAVTISIRRRHHSE